jgi:hypothetical protein
VTCKELQYELDAVIDGRAPVDALFHLAICAPCRQLVSQLKSFHRFASTSPHPMTPFELRDRIGMSLSGDPLRGRLERAPSTFSEGDDLDLRFRN